MINTEQKLQEWRKACEPLREKLLDAIVEEYANKLGTSPDPSESVIQDAEYAVARLIESKIDNQWVEAIYGGPLPNSEFAESVKWAVRKHCPLPKLSDLLLYEERLPLCWIVVWGIFGCLLGMLVLDFLVRVALGEPITGLFLGALVGPVIGILVVWHAAYHDWVRRIIQTTLGVAVVVEILNLAKDFSFRKIISTAKRVWSYTQIYTPLKRIGLYILLIIILLSRVRLERKLAKDRSLVAVRSVMMQWFDVAILTIGILVETQKGKTQTPSWEDLLGEIAQKLTELRRLPPEDLPEGIEEVIAAFTQRGITVDEPDTFVWQTESYEKYETFGEVEPGDRVIVERSPVIREGNVIKKGLVRKDRKRS
ncbi:MAG TPA: hypothetical protein PK777_05855 [Thermoguttaceae bacterium]|nr:hypothetical protein [Thermoguttaceae bacterium]